jgi:hypothetical protein
MKKLIFPVALLLLITLTFTTCDLINGLLDDDDDENTGDITGTYELSTNPSDPTIMKATREDGTVYTFFGKKDLEGSPEKTDVVSVQFPDDTKSYTVMVKDDGAPGKIFTPEGSTFEFVPSTEKEFFLKVVSKTGEIRLNIKINVDSLNKSAIAPSIPEYPTNSGKRQETGGSISFRPFSEQNIPQTTGVNGNKLVLNLTQCGYPTGMNVMPVLIMEPPAGNAVLGISNKVGNGVYEFGLPDPSVPNTQISKTCKKVSKIMDKLCFSYSISTFATSLLVKTTLEQQFPNATDKESINKVADKVVKVLPELCKIKDEVNISSFCEVVGEVYFNPNPDQYNYTLLAYSSGKEIVIPMDNFNPNTGGTITYDIPGDFELIDLYTDPDDPAPYEGYSAIAVVDCVNPQGTEVTMTVVGSDGYTKSETQTITLPGEVMLNVPGGAESVRDMITVSANGQYWEIYIEF